jgi:hypothetical protein
VQLLGSLWQTHRNGVQLRAGAVDRLRELIGVVPTADDAPLWKSSLKRLYGLRVGK